MNFEAELKKLIKKKYGSIRAFSQTTNIPYSSIDNIFKRGIMGVSIQIVLKICSELNIDVEKIQEDKLVIKEKNITLDDGHLMYEQLDDNDKAEIRGEMKQMLKSAKYNKCDIIQESINQTIAEEINNAVKTSKHHV